MDSYFAGLIDGEGCISVNAGTRKDGRAFHVPRISVGMTDRVVVYALQEFYGGTVREYQENGKPFYRWTLGGFKRIRIFLSRLMPHLIVKEGQAELLYALCLRAKEHKGRTSPQELRYRDGIKAQIQHLNHCSWHQQCMEFAPEFMEQGSV